MGEESHARIEEVQDTSDTLVIEAVSTIEEKLVIDDSITVLEEEEEAGVSVDEVISVLEEEKEEAGVVGVDEAAPTYAEFDGERVPSYEEFASGALPEPLFQKRNVVLDHGSCLFLALTFSSTSMQPSTGLPLYPPSPPVSASSPTTPHLAYHGSLFSPGSPPVLAIDRHNHQRTSPRPLIPPTSYRFFRLYPFADEQDTSAGWEVDSTTCRRIGDAWTDDTPRHRSRKRHPLDMTWTRVLLLMPSAATFSFGRGALLVDDCGCR
ncbi:hypothetical protein C8R44DRAFT_798928 [Mycena epipterygia]|nr:hypothetical protein C8R44DRAFT_798928 [Mycena epipterygia]